ncbi:hypothetical protein PVAP13_9NG681628 [Panicum virgatum]|uniref:Uncharacterized protein n=1 Tax=Panicum virgatum TaxID=38727 RepID=A0A8T0MWB5_PANVG|nr:hypothetical protein PVAP13_9NG681628 [Panicum virgatum]
MVSWSFELSPRSMQGLLLLFCFWNLQVSAAKRMPIKSFTGSVGNGEAFHYSDIST